MPNVVQKFKSKGGIDSGSIVLIYRDWFNSTDSTKGGIEIGSIVLIVQREV